MSNPEADRYLLDLRKELTIRGLKKERVNQVVDETQSHLSEMLVDANPETRADLMKQFGSAKLLARKIGEEYERSAASRKFWWPAILTTVWIVLIADATLPRFLFSQAAVLIFIGCLFVLGFLARKPCLGQFVAAYAVLTLIGTLWACATQLPIVDYAYHGGQFLISNSELPQFESDARNIVTRDEAELDEQNRLGKAYQDDSVMKHDRREIAQEKGTLSYISWIKAQPLSEKLKLDFLQVAPEACVGCAIALVITNLGGLLWALLRDVRRLWRRIKYSRGPLSA